MCTYTTEIYLYYIDILILQRCTHSAEMQHLKKLDLKFYIGLNYNIFMNLNPKYVSVFYQLVGAVVLPYLLTEIW